MEKMTYNEFITRPYRIWKRIMHKSDEVIRIEAICMKSTQVFGERVQSSFDNSQERNYIALVEAKRELNELMDEHKRAQDEVREFLYDNLSINEADLLEWKYIDGKSIKDIAELLHEQEQTVRNKASKYEKKARNIFIKV